LAKKACSSSSDACGRCSYSMMNIFCKKSSASGEISDGIVGFADAPICMSRFRHEPAFAVN
jgi:hypothetical protein